MEYQPSIWLHQISTIHQTVENKPLISKQRDIAALRTHPLSHKLKGSLGEDIDGIYNTREVTKQCQHQTDPKFRLRKTPRGGKRMAMIMSMKVAVPILIKFDKRQKTTRGRERLYNKN